LKNKYENSYNLLKIRPIIFNTLAQTGTGKLNIRCQKPLPVCGNGSNLPGFSNQIKKPYISARPL
jgi:hypothetical protein